MKLFLRFGNLLVIALFLLLVFIALDRFDYLPRKTYSDECKRFCCQKAKI